MLPMYSFILPLLQTDQPAGPGLIANLLPFLAIILIFYFLIIRPQSKKRKETERMLGALKKGDKIITIGGIYGTIQNVRETTVIVKVDDNVKLEFLRSAISTILTPSRDNDDRNAQSERDSSESGE